MVLLACLLLAPVSQAAVFTLAEARIDGGPATTMNPAGEQNLYTNYWTSDFAVDLDSSQLIVGPHWVEVRMQDLNGIWSSWQGCWITVTGPVKLAAAEWFVDQDPGPGAANPIPLPEDGKWDNVEELVSATVPTENLSEGWHQLCIRFQASDGRWGLGHVKTFCVAAPLYLTAAEWTLDPLAKPGSGTPLRAVDGWFDQPVEELIGEVNTDLFDEAAENGFIYVRVKDSLGRWSTRQGWFLNPANAQWQFDPARGWAGGQSENIVLFPDTTPPKIVAVQAISSSRLLAVRFNKLLDTASATQTTNYTLGGVSPIKATLKADGRSVELQFAQPINPGLTLGVNHVADASGNPLAQQVFAPVSVLPFTSVDLGTSSDPLEPGSTFSADGVNFDLVSGGGDLGSSLDRGQFVYAERKGDFDVRVRVERLDKLDGLTKAGLMVRESTNANARFVMNLVTPPSGANTYQLLSRSAAGSNAISAAIQSGAGVAFPDAWLRLKRSQNTFSAYRSTNGWDWVLLGNVNVAMTNVVRLGLAATAHTNRTSFTTTAWFRDYSDLTPVLTSQTSSYTAAAGSTAVLQADVRGADPLNYQWFFNDAVLRGRTASSLVLTNVSTNHQGAYYLVANNALGSVTSAVINLTVDLSNPAKGYEADLSPRGNEDGQVSVADWTLIGRMAAKLLFPTNASEYARVDCAPRATLGDGQINVADWVQAGRYAAKLDPLTGAGGPIAPPAKPAPPRPALAGPGMSPPPPRECALWGEWEAASGGHWRLHVGIQGTGRENALGLSLRFDPAQMQFAGAAGPAGTLILNDTRVAEGILGWVLGGPSGQSFGLGKIELLALDFRILKTGSIGAQWESTPVAMEVADVEGVSYALAPQQNPVVFNAPPVGAAIGLYRDGSPGGVSLTLRGQPGERFQVETSTDLATWTPLPGVYEGGQTVHVIELHTPGTATRFYRASQLP